jgi:hypothetical protein
LAISLYACGSDPEPFIPPIPVATAATFITKDSFTANWNDAAGASSYELDIAADEDFTTILVTVKDAVTAEIIFGLASNTEYFYRVRAVFTGQELSGNSNVISLYTLPESPVASPATNVTSDGFTANWQHVTGITNYLLYLSLDNFASDPPVYVAGYDGIAVTGETHDVSGLNSTTIYYYALKAKGDNSISFFSNSIFVETTN